MVVVVVGNNNIRSPVNHNLSVYLSVCVCLPISSSSSLFYLHWHCLFFLLSAALIDREQEFDLIKLGSFTSLREEEGKI